MFLSTQHPEQFLRSDYCTWISSFALFPNEATYENRDLRVIAFETVSYVLS